MSKQRPPILESDMKPVTGQRYTLLESFVQDFQVVKDPYIVERILNEATGETEIVEKRISEGPMVIRGVFQREGVKNANGRTYGLGLWERHLKSDAKLMVRIQERACWGQIEHPERGTTTPENAAIMVTKLERVLDEDKDSATIIGEAEVLDMPKGRIVRDMLRCGMRVGVSSRATGTVDSRGNVDERTFEPETWDVVGSPSTPGAFPKVVDNTKTNTVQESKQPAMTCRCVQDKSGKFTWTIVESATNRLVEKYTGQAETKSGGHKMSGMPKFNTLRQLCEASLSQITKNATIAQRIALDNALTQQSVDFNALVEEDATLKNVVAGMQDRIKAKRDEIAEATDPGDETPETDEDLDESKKDGDEGDEEAMTLEEAIELLGEAEKLITKQELTIKSEQSINNTLTEKLATAERDLADVTESLVAKDRIISALTEQHNTIVSDAVDEAVRANPALVGVRPLMERCTSLAEVNSIVESAKKEGTPAVIVESGLPTPGAKLDTAKDQTLNEGADDDTGDVSEGKKEDDIHPLARVSTRMNESRRKREKELTGSDRK